MKTKDRVRLSHERDDKSLCAFGSELMTSFGPASTTRGIANWKILICNQGSDSYLILLQRVCL
jgi:hypothetical protein